MNLENKSFTSSHMKIVEVTAIWPIPPEYLKQNTKRKEQKTFLIKFLEGFVHYSNHKSCHNFNCMSTRDNAVM